ncbi:Transmembrane secretion effector [Halogranum amylolyticum]|uniref:Transmembrane secretion effector n=1 Tax=Halogranum amylolyticum TaxID=660520 RepID=A0A1H8PNF3_9EURY|nr:MFS transporter [Halogranum amylolyticum]SEO43490.1 Transmembrane secretion effector [Halogranum amylolyticum]
MTVADTARAEPSLWRNRDFQRFFAGQFVTNAGDSLYTVAVLWLVFELSGSTVLTGVANALLLLPWLLQILAGPVVDRLPLRPVLVGSQLLQGVVVLVLPLAAATGRLSVVVLLAVVPVLTLATLLMSPMQATLVPRIVPDARLSRANSALATVTLGLDMVFDALGGAFIAAFGATTLFLFDSVTFAVAGLLFAGIAVPSSSAVDGEDGGDESEEKPEGGDESVLGSYLADLRDGVDVLRGTVFVELVLTTAVANFATGVTLAILPAFGDGVGGPAVYGLLLGALGVGRLVGSLVAPYLEDVAYGRVLLVGNSVAACCWVAAVYAPSATLTVVLFGLAWVPAGASGVLTSTLNQTVFPADLLGRVSSIKGTASGATLPVGSLVGGVVAELVGPTTMGLAAFGFGFTGLYVLVRPRLRRLPAVGDADPAAFDVTPSASRDE